MYTFGFLFSVFFFLGPCWRFSLLSMQLRLHPGLMIAQHNNRAVATSVCNLTAKAADVKVLALVTRVCKLDCAKLAQ